AGDRSQGHHAVADVVHVHVDAGERPAAHRDAFPAVNHLAPHVGEDFGKAHVSLKALSMKPRHRYFPARDCGRSEEITGSGRIRLDRVVAQPRVPARVHALPNRVDLVRIAVGFGAAMSFDSRELACRDVEMISARPMTNLKPPLADYLG